MKLMIALDAKNRIIVAPRAGAWVETGSVGPPPSQGWRRTPCGCVG